MVKIHCNVSVLAHSLLMKQVLPGQLGEIAQRNGLTRGHVDDIERFLLLLEDLGCFVAGKDYVGRVGFRDGSSFLFLEAVGAISR